MMKHLQWWAVVAVVLSVASEKVGSFPKQASEWLKNVNDVDDATKWNVQDQRLETLFNDKKEWLLDDSPSPSYVDPLENNQQLRGTANLVRAFGYPVEQSTVRTEDGYLLTVFRIPRPGRPVVFLMHGVLSSSADFVVMGKNDSLAFSLYDAGFDVWMGNARGTTASRHHESLDPDQAEFWDFSWHEIGERDLPATIDHILSVTKQTALHYVGHSQGTTTFFVMGSERPEYMAKIKTHTALAPIAFLRDIRSAPLRVFAMASKALGFILKLVGDYEFLPNNRFISWMGDHVCAHGDITLPLCSDIVFLVCGTDSQLFNASMLPDIMVNDPAGASTKQMLHFGQNARGKELAMKKFDYGWLSNMMTYLSLQPPEYDLRRVTAPTYLVYSDNDLLSTSSNLEELKRRLPNIRGVRRVPFAAFNHVDYIFGTRAKELVYDDVVASILEDEAQTNSSI